MAQDDPIQALTAMSRTFGGDVAARKLQLLCEVGAHEGLSAKDLSRLQDVLNFMRAYPDDAPVRREVLALVSSLRTRAAALRTGRGGGALQDSGLPGSTNSYAYSYQVLRRLARRSPSCVELDWDALGNEANFAAVLELILTSAENEGMENLDESWEDWVQGCKHSPSISDLEFLLQLFENSCFDELQQANLFESCELYCRYELSEPDTGRCEVELPLSRPHYQRRDVPRERFPLEPEIQKPLPSTPPLDPHTGLDVIGRCVAALCCRNLEIYPLIWADPRDVRVHDCGRGVQVILVGVPPMHRSLLVAMYAFIVVKNGVPLGYGPASPFMACCEMGINLFPEFRGGEIRYIYAQVMRVLHHVLGVECFYLTDYGMGVGNPEAIQTGAFWFYRKLGFVPSNPQVEALARQEEERMRADRSYRSDTRMLHRLKHTEAYLDLSGGRRRRLEFGDLGRKVSAFIAREFAGSRPEAERTCTLRVRRALGLRSLAGWTDGERMMLTRLALILAMIPELAAWRPAEKAALVRILRAKAARSEARAAHLMSRHSRLEAALRALTGEEA